MRSRDESVKAFTFQAHHAGSVFERSAIINKSGLGNVCYPASPQRSEARMEAERRQVTVLFADMVGFTSFSERSGEEAAFTLIRSLSKLMDEAVREHGGVVQGFT